MNDTAIDPDALKRYSFSVWSFKMGEMVSLMIHLGDRLGLYKALQGEGAVTAAELAEKTGLKERWLLEWLRGQAAARLLHYHDGDRFELPAEGAEVLANEEGSLAFAAGAFSGQTPPETVDKLAEAFRTGIGLSYQDLGPERGTQNGAHARTLDPTGAGAEHHPGPGRGGRQARGGCRGGGCGLRRRRGAHRHG